MKYNFNGKNINIPDTTIQKTMQGLNVSKDEAIQIYLEDEGYLDNEEQTELDQKAKNNHITATIHQARMGTQKKTQRERVKKEDATKEMIIAEMAAFLPTIADNIAEVRVKNPTKLVTFELDGVQFTIDLIRNRKKDWKFDGNEWIWVIFERKSLIFYAI